MRLGKTFGGRRGKEQRPEEEKRLTQRPMAGALKGVRAGPECMECRGPIDARNGWSVGNPKGSRKHQRHGYLHQDCQEKAEKRFRENHVNQDGVYTPRLAVPLLSEEDINDIVDGKGNEA